MKVQNIYFEEGLQNVKQCLPVASSVYVIADRNLSAYYSYFDGYEIIDVDVSEGVKTLQTVEYVIGELLERGADRDSLLVGFGGGITTDIVGFVASVYMRGVRFGFVPTTLLSQVDASVGGKNGVNFQDYKNIVGVINQPDFVYIAGEVLKTLPQREFRAGVSEILKIFMIYDAEYYRCAVEYFSGEGSGDLLSLIQRSVELKSEVVERDERESGERKKLNLGHTFAHAIEKIAQGKGIDIMHGEAVAVGLCVAAKFAEQYSGVGQEFSDRIEKDLQSVGLSSVIPKEVEMDALIEALRRDKKVSGEELSLILPFDFERVEIVKLSLEKVKEVLL